MKTMLAGLTMVAIGTISTYSPDGALGLAVCLMVGVIFGATVTGCDRLMKYFAER
jgi:hypothetical protein